jgi:hypothetical protein
MLGMVPYGFLAWPHTCLPDTVHSHQRMGRRGITTQERPSTLMGAMNIT